MFHESPAATADMVAVPCVLGCRTLRRTIQVRLGSNPAVPRDGCPVARPSSRSRHGNHEISGLLVPFSFAIYEIYKGLQPGLYATWRSVLVEDEGEHRDIVVTGNPGQDRLSYQLGHTGKGHEVNDTVKSPFGKSH
jgi:hypothetical protein